MIISNVSGFRIIKKLTSYKDFFPLLFVVFLAILAGRGLIGAGYFNMHDDLQVMRQLSMEKCFLDGQIPCRWVPDMGYGYGYPLFNYYPPLPYLVGEIIRMAGFTFIGTVKILFVTSFVASGITMYFLAKEFFGRFGGVISSAFYIWAPYHSVDVYVRGAMNEAWALIWFPFILWSSYKLIVCDSRENWKWILTLAIGWFGLFTSHNLMVIIFGPVFAIWLLIWVLRYRAWRKIISLGKAGLVSFGLAAFFTLPVLLEKNIVQTGSLVVGYYEYTAHFVSLPQLLTSRFWGYGPSVWGVADDRMSFQIGWVHWSISLFVLLLLAYRLIRDKRLRKWEVAAAFLIFIGWFAAFMAHSRSTPIWQLVTPWKFVQFPWRFLTLVIFGFSFAAGALNNLLPKIVNKIVGFIFIIAVIVYSYNFFLPETGKLGPITDEEKLSGVAWDMQQTAGIYDYLPNTAKTAPKAPQRNLAEIFEGEGEVIGSVQGTDWARFTVDVSSEQADVRINILEFPDWSVFVDGEMVPEYVPESEEWGRMHIALPRGRHEVSLELKNTPVRKAGNLVTIATVALIGGYVFSKKRQKD